MPAFSSLFQDSIDFDNSVAIDTLCFWEHYSCLPLCHLGTSLQLLFPVLVAHAKH